ncbi:hypothetical protein CsSME_00037322 [Camellia sinensis var. sinensis]
MVVRPPKTGTMSSPLEADFGLLCSSLTQVITSRPLLRALVESCWERIHPYIGHAWEVTRATRACGRRVSRVRRRIDWPELLTMLTCWRHTEDAYQVPIELVAAGHELVRASIEYIGGALELIASLMGIVQRRETLLSPHDPTHTDGTSGSCSTCTSSTSSSNRDERERQAPTCGRGRFRGTRDESNPSEPILSDDDVEMSDSEEAVSQHSESSESGDDTGLGSESGDDMTPAWVLVQVLLQIMKPMKTVPQSPLLRGRGQRGSLEHKATGADLLYFFVVV